MTSKNICKFPMPAVAESLKVSCFVLEAVAENLREKRRILQHRAILTVEGEGILHFDGEAVPFSKGSLLFGFAGEELWAECDDPQLLYVQFEGGRAEELFRRFGIRVGRRSFSGMDGLAPLWQESLARATEETVDLAAESVLLYTFSRLSSKGVGQNSAVDRMLALSEEEFRDPALSLAEVARRLSYHSKYLSHLFKETMGKSYSEYLCTLRIRYAVSLFDLGLGSVKNVALLSGFSDPLYFSSVFKRHVGLSPKEYRASVGGHMEKTEEK